MVSMGGGMHSICMWEVACGVGYEDRDFEFFVDVIVKEKYILYVATRSVQNHFSEKNLQGMSPYRTLQACRRSASQAFSTQSA